jgi:hypothetical protein
MAIMHSAWFNLRSPARDSWWRITWPLEASSGAVPVWAAKWCLLGNRPMSPTSPRNVAASMTPLGQQMQHHRLILDADLP